MILFKKAVDISLYLNEKRKGKAIVGFVPTMGALHVGHVSLIRQAQRESSLTVCSIFVNPVQFNDPNDLKNYPRPIEKDIEMLALAGCDVLFLPDVEDVYPEGTAHLKDFDLGHLENFLEGASRPGHFKGVANVVDRFLKILQPDLLFLGQKDFQQVKVLERLIKTSGYNITIKMCEIVREENGLAMSSRNVRLTQQQRQNAAGISQVLFWARDHHTEFSVEDLEEESKRRINLIPEAMVDYLKFCDAQTFQLIGDWIEAKQVAAVTAVKMGNTRLLDNVVFN